MSSRRVLKAAEAVREVVGWAILTEIKDPRVKNVTVTYVEMSGDLRQAKVYVSIMGDEATQNLSLRGLQNSAGFLQSKLSDRINTRYTPRIEFILDQGVKKSIAISEILRRELDQSQTASDGPQATSAKPEEEASATEENEEENDSTP